MTFNVSEDLNAMAATFGMKNLPMMPPMGNPMAALNATASQAHPVHNNNNHHSSSSGNPSGANQNESNLNNSRAASTPRPHSATGTPVSKKAKTELDEDGELEIDVQNDDATSSSARPSSASHANGTSHKNLKSGRESAQSLSSRDSSATPKSNKQNLNSQAAMAAGSIFKCCLLYLNLTCSNGRRHTNAVRRRSECIAWNEWFWWNHALYGLISKKGVLSHWSSIKWKGAVCVPGI